MEKTVHVMLYRHRFGTDFSVYASDERAVAAVGEIIMDNIGEVSRLKDQNQIKRLIKEGKIYQAVGVYETEMDESFEISPREVHE